MVLMVEALTDKLLLITKDVGLARNLIEFSLRYQDFSICSTYNIADRIWTEKQTQFR